LPTSEQSRYIKESWLWIKMWWWSKKVSRKKELLRCPNIHYIFQLAVCSRIFWVLDVHLIIIY
jgi:hypothetical protein